MASEMRRIATMVAQSRQESFPSAHGLEASVSRLDAAILRTPSGIGLRGGVTRDGVGLTWGGADSHPESGKVRCGFMGRWKTEGDGASLEGIFIPAGKTLLFLKSVSILLALLLASSAYAWFAEDIDPVMRGLVFVTTVLAILGFPFAIVAFGSQREAEEANIARAIRKALAAPDAPT